MRKSSDQRKPAAVLILAFFLTVQTVTISTARAQSLALSPTSVNLGNITVAGFVTTSAISVTYNTGSWSSYTLRVYTQNAGGQPGLVGQSNSSIKLPFKVWTANFGGGSTMPPPATPPNWVNYWQWVPDKAEMSSSDPYSWRRLTWNGNSSPPCDNSTVTSPFNVYFGFDLELDGFTKQTYSGTVYFELIDKCSSDAGAQSVIVPFTLTIQLSYGVVASVSLTPTSLTSNITTTDTRVLVSGTVSATIKATGLRSHNATYNYNALTVRVYTENNLSNPGLVQNGLKGLTNTSQSIPVKVWVPNFGPGVDANNDGIPDVDNDKNWKDPDSTVWVYAFDKNKPITDAAPYNYTLFNFTDLFKLSALDANNPVPPGVLFINPNRNNQDGRLKIRFALSLDSKAAPQTYQSRIYVELGLSRNNGATIHVTRRKYVTLTATLSGATPIITLTGDKSALAFSGLSTFSGRTLAQDSVKLSLDARGLYNYNAASFRVLTDNGLDANANSRLGMKGSTLPDWSVPLRVWTSNYGPGIDGNADGIPDVANDTNWKGNQAVWVYVLDKAAPGRESWPPNLDPNNAWGRPLFDFTELQRWSDFNDQLDGNGDYVYHVPQHIRLIDRTANDGTDNRVAVYFAADFTDAMPQSYSTALKIEAAFSSDGGYTIARKESLTVNLSATVPGNGGDALAWLQNRVDMRPDLDGATGTVKKLADSHQNENDESDAAFIYDQALAIMALARAGDYTRARQIIEGLRYLQNSDGSFFFSYMTTADEAQVTSWATTDANNNGKPDELENRVNYSANNGLDSTKQQIKSWIYGDYSVTVCPQTQTTLPDKIKYRTLDFRKFTGSITWVAMALNYYEQKSGDSQFRDVLDGVINYLKSVQQTSLATSTDSLDYGGVRVGRNFFFWAGDTTQGVDGMSIDGFVNLRSYAIEHNLDAYSAFRYYGNLTGDQDASSRAQLLHNFILNNLWAPNVNTSLHPEAVGQVENCFFVGYDLTPSSLNVNPKGVIDVAHYLDAQSWSVLALGPSVSVKDKNGVAGALSMALAFLDATDNRSWTDCGNAAIPSRPFLKASQLQTIYAGTAAAVSGIDGYKERAREKYYQTPGNPRGEFVWSEGTEGVVAARYLNNETASADYYHAETTSYKLANGGVPYSTLPVPDSVGFKPSACDNRIKDSWSFGDNASVAGTAWYYFNQLLSNARLNPFQPYAIPETPVFSENFQTYTAGQNPKTSDWNALIVGNWFWEATNTAGSMWMKGTHTGSDQLLEIKSAAPANFTLKCDIRFPTTAALQAGMFFRKQPSVTSFYAFYLEEGQGATSAWAAVLAKIQNGVFTKLGGVGIGETVALNKTYKLKVEGNGSTFKCYVDKGAGYTLYLNVTDATFAAGTLGLRGNVANGALWDNVVLYDVPGAAKAATVAALDEQSKPAADLPTAYALYPNYPNPFNPQTAVRFDLPEAQRVSLMVYDISGRRVKTLVEAEMPAGRHQASWDARNDDGVPVATGIYFIRLRAGNFSHVHKAALLK